VLINSDTLILKPENPEALMNVNTPEDAEKAEEDFEKLSFLTTKGHRQ
jgi:molybdopterin-guanine dinucleotide biosynthesis protein A